MTLGKLKGSPLIIQCGHFYCSLPANIENLEYAKKWLQFMIDHLKKQEESQNRDLSETPEKEEKP